MTTEEFTKIYWTQYIQLEKEFSQTLFYLALDEENDDAYSQAYSKLMLEIGSEVDVVIKEYLRTAGPKFDKRYRTMDKYRKYLISSQPEFVSQRVLIKNYSREVQPWADWIKRPDKAHYWWEAYNAVKHNRTGKEKVGGIENEKECYKFANQKYTLFALAGLYQIMVYFYHYLAEAEGLMITTPLPGSRLFELTGGKWDSENFYGDSAFYLDENGNMIWETGLIHY